MTEPSNYEAASSQLKAWDKVADPELSGPDSEAALEAIRTGAPVTQAWALLAVADELGRIRELLAERLVKPAPMTVNYGTWRPNPPTDEEREELRKNLAERAARPANGTPEFDARLWQFNPLMNPDALGDDPR